MEMKPKRGALEGAGHLFTDASCSHPGTAWFISKEMVAAIRAVRGRPYPRFDREVVA